MAFRFSRAGIIGSAFSAVRSIVSALGLRRWATLTKIKPPLTYRRSYDASKYLTNLSIKYLKERPAYNDGWEAMVSNMISELKTGAYIRGTVTKNHDFDYDDGTGYHSVTYDVDIYHNLEGATNHPDLMANYIQELEDMFRDYKQCYKDSEVSQVSSREEWETRQMALEKYRSDVEDLMSEID